MEKCVDSDYLQPEYEITETQKNATTLSNDSCLSGDAQEESERKKEGCKAPRVDEKIASQERCSGPSNVMQNGAREKVRRRHRSGRRVNVLKKKQRATGTARQSVQKKTKTNTSNVPDRLGKYVSRRFRSETKLSLGDRDRELEKKPSSGTEGERKAKVALLGNECLSNKEADRLRNSFESDSETKNIFEKFFDDCLDSTSRRGEGVSSQEDVNGGNCKEKAAETTPKKRKTEAASTGAPVKMKDHSSYYSNHKNMRHVCEYCHKIFKSNGKLNSHVYSHTGERPFDCSHCGKAFSSKFKLVRHLLIHSEVRRFVCQICDRTFLRNDHLKNHYKVHDPQKKMYKCPKENCDKEYSSIMSHKKHMAYHNVEDGDLKCSICNVKYETKEEVLFHLKSHSGSRLFKTQSDKKFKCEFCGRLFLTRKDVTRHLVVHTGERDFLCQFCPQRFGRKDHLVRHIKKSHGNEDLLRGEETKTAAREETANREETNNPEPPNTHTEDSQTHILITLQGKALHSRKKHKPFHKNELLVPKKKQVPSPKAKSPTTQILLQNIPNILIIPNNSIILLRNQTPAKKTNDSPASDPSVAPPTPTPTPNPEPSPASAQPPNTPDFANFSLDPSIFPSPGEFLPEFPESDSFSDFHPDLPSFGPHFGEADFEIPNQGDLLGGGPPESGLLGEAPREARAGAVKAEREEGVGGSGGVERGLFGEGNEGLMLNESILNEFKDDSSGMLASDGEVGMLGNLVNQNSENCGFELLRHLLTSDNPALSPLPGFSQIFPNSNTNPN